MKHHIFNFLKTYSTKPIDVDRLIISSFVKRNNIQVINNFFVKEYIITSASSEEYDILEKFLSIINKYSVEYNFEFLIELFEFVVSPADRIINGAVYTPKYIRDYIIKQSIINKDLVQAKIADISCGCGGFLYTASIALKETTNLSYIDIFTHHIYGVDIQDYSITRTKLLLSLLAIANGEDISDYNFNLFVGDSLVFKWENQLPNFNGFTIIVGNPPYVRLRNLSDNTKSFLKNWEVCSTGLTDLYIPFFQIGFENLEPNGTLGYITMNSFFKSLNGRALRDYFQTRRPLFRIIDFGNNQIFKSKNTYTCICLIQNVVADLIEYKIINPDDLYSNIGYSEVRYDILDSHKGWNLQEEVAISKLETIGQPFGEKYKTRHGIATLKNKVYIFKPIKEDSQYYYLKDKISATEYPIEKSICRDIINSNRINDVVSLSEIMEKIIFPYVYNGNDKPTILDEEILKSKFPFAYKYLEEKKEILAKRDKGKGQYPRWYAFGRTQSLEKVKHKLFFPKISNKPPTTIIDSNEDLLYYNGQAIIEQDTTELKIIQKLLESKIFWHYITKTSKPYSSDYYSLNGNYISNFGICDLTEQEKAFVLRETDHDLLNSFFEEKYS